MSSTRLHSYDNGKICAGKIHHEYFIHTEFSTFTYSPTRNMFTFVCFSMNVPFTVSQFNKCLRGLDNLMSDNSPGFLKQAELF